MAMVPDRAGKLEESIHRSVLAAMGSCLDIREPVLNWTPEQVQEHETRRRGVATESPNKYRRSNRGDRTYGGIVYDSKREARHAQELDVLKAAGRVVKIERQIPFELRVNDHKVTKIVIDFRVTWHTGEVVLQEIKGYATKDWIVRRKLFQALYPDLKYEVIK